MSDDKNQKPDFVITDTPKMMVGNGQVYGKPILVDPTKVIVDDLDETAFSWVVEPTVSITPPQPEEACGDSCGS